MTDLLRRGCSTTSTAEGDQLRATVDGLGPDGWTRADAGAGLDRRHPGRAPALDRRGRRPRRALARGPEAKQAWDDVVLAAINDPMGYVDEGAFELAELPRDEVLDALGRGPDGARATPSPRCPAGQKMPWFGPPMSAASMATARFMETWAHALDVYDAAGERPEPTDRIRHVAHLGVRTRNYAYSVHQEEPPAEEFRVELTAPSGELWTWGPEDAAPVGARAGVRLLPAGHPAGQPRRHRPGRGRRRRRALAGHRAGVRRPARPRDGRSTA